MSARLLVLLAVSLGFGVESANWSAGAGNSALAWLHLPVHARVAGLGGAVSAYGTDAASAFINPALTGFAPDIRLSGSYEMLTLDRTHNFGGVVMPLFPRQSIGLGWSSYGVDDIERRSENGILEGAFADRENAIALFYAYGDSSKWLCGLSARYYSQTLDDVKANGFGVDAGVYYRPLSPVRLGLAGQNLLGQMNWPGGASDRLAPAVRLGAALFSPWTNKWLTSLAVSGDGEYTMDNSPQAHGGVEAWFNNLFCARVGVETPNPTQYSGGLGLRYKMFAVDYAFVYHESGLGHSHLYSLSIDIGELFN